VGLTAILDTLLKQNIEQTDLLISAIIPALISFPVVYTLLRLTYQLNVTENTLRELSQRDPLTGPHNRRYLFDFAQTKVERGRRYGSRLSVLMIDLDHFKNINDTYGHDVGDKVLREAARSCNEILRKIDVLGRYGGEEFVMILPETGLIDAVALGQRLRNRIELLEVYSGSTRVKVTASIGVASLSALDAGIESVLVRADEAMYQAKSSGRNQVRATEAI
jgi:diguanylate cyclase (GGDEF)-like protein